MSRAMPRLRRALAVLAFTFLSLLAAGPATAGGPTSVLIVEPNAGRAAALYVVQADYQSLVHLLGVDGVAPDPAGPAPAATGAAETGPGRGRVVTVTWLIHDALVWRVDRVYLSEGAAVRIATQQDFDGSGNVWDRPVSWHSTERGPQIVALLKRLGLSPASSAPTGTAPTEGAATGTAATEPAATPSAHGLLWALAGLALGVALTLGLGPARRAPGTPDLPSPASLTGARGGAVR